MKGKHVSTGIDCIRLVEDRFSVGQCESGWIRESADAAERSKIVAEGAVFLHQQDHMFDVFQRAASCSSLPQQPPHVRWQAAARRDAPVSNRRRVSLETEGYDESIMREVSFHIVAVSN
jgi:hypothetical protein